MKIPIITIGNSRGIRIPKTVLEQVGFSDELELSVEKNSLVLSPVEEARVGWTEKFKHMAVKGDDTLLEAVSTEWDDQEWQW